MTASKQSLSNGSISDASIGVGGYQDIAFGLIVVIALDDGTTVRHFDAAGYRGETSARGNEYEATAFVSTLALLLTGSTCTLADLVGRRVHAHIAHDRIVGWDLIP